MTNSSLLSVSVRSVTHVSALTVFSKNVAPGEKPKLEGVLEQRVTSFVVHILIGKMIDTLLVNDVEFLKTLEMHIEYILC